ncbi:MAG: hypothetical protein IPK07_17255 [Deltaproteobacteria bacterium]|nr:hypothetical protein [Deltaproteobacteria bacterium]
MAMATLLGADDPKKPRIGTASEPPRNTREHGGDAVPEAARWLARYTLAKGDADAAAAWLRRATGTYGVMRGRDTELEELTDAIRIARQKKADQQPSNDGYGSAQPRRGPGRHGGRLRHGLPR